MRKRRMKLPAVATAEELIAMISHCRPAILHIRADSRITVRLLATTSFPDETGADIGARSIALR